MTFWQQGSTVSKPPAIIFSSTKAQYRRHTKKAMHGLPASPLTPYLLPITYHPLPITYYPLPITHYLLPITHYLLPISYLASSTILMNAAMFSAPATGFMRS